MLLLDTTLRKLTLEDVSSFARKMLIKLATDGYRLNACRSTVYEVKWES
jgi:hypothetical protein